MGEATRDITGTTLSVFCIGLLLAASFWTVRPFLTSFVWATMIVIATWPVMLWLQAHLWRSRGAAVTVTLVLILLVVIVPFLLAMLTLIDRGDEVAGRLASITEIHLPAPPEWVDGIPLVGPKIADSWRHLISLSEQELATQLGPFTKKAVKWFVAQAGSLAMMVLQFFLTVVISGVLYARGEAAAAGVGGFARRLAGRHGEEAATLAARAVRSVALGIVVTAIIQSAVGGIVLAAVGVPHAALLTAAMFMLCLAQFGPAPVMIPAVVWLYWNHGALWGTLLLVFAIMAQIIDNFIRPVLIRRGADLSLALVIPGVIGGLISFGVMGLFIGPVVLAVAFTLLKVWVRREGASMPAAEDR
jgi:predicted PurR-regulated permease PerM